MKELAVQVHYILTLKLFPSSDEKHYRLGASFVDKYVEVCRH